MARKKSTSHSKQPNAAKKASGPPRHLPFKAAAAQLSALVAGDPDDPTAAHPAVGRTTAARMTAAGTTAKRPAVPQVNASAAPRPTADPFAAAMADVAPLRTRTGRVGGPRRPTPTARAQQETVLQIAATATFEAFMESFERPSWAATAGDPALLELERGHFPVDAKVDLHGYTADRATRRIRSFLGEAQQRRWRCVRIIHGQGHRSAGDPVLRGACRRALQRHERLVQAWCEALPAGGGPGATLVLIRQR